MQWILQTGLWVPAISALIAPVGMFLAGISSNAQGQSGAGSVPLFLEHFFANSINDGNGPPVGQWDGGAGAYGFMNDEAGAPGIFFVQFIGSNKGCWWSLQNSFSTFNPALNSLKLRIRARATAGSGKCGITTDSPLQTSGGGPTNGNISALTATMATYEFTAAPSPGIIFVGAWGTNPRFEVDKVEIVLA